MNERCAWYGNGLSTEPYDFEIYPLPDNPSLPEQLPPLPDKAAIYIFARIDSHGCYESIYIGQTGDLSCRFESDRHKKMDCIQDHAPSSLHICTCHYGFDFRDKRQRILIEGDLHDRHGALCSP